jgi:Ca-activated chloride channel family protein
MEFLSPLWLLLASIAIPVIALYLFKPKRREQRVSTLLFWQQILRERSERPSIRRLRQLLSLLLLLLFLLAATFSAGRPIWGKDAVGQDAVLLLDISASMQSQEGSQTRCDLAKSRAQSLLASLPAGTQTSLLAMGPTPRILASRTQDTGLLSQALDRVSCSNGRAAVEESLTLAADLARSQKPVATLYLVSDGGGLQASDAKLLEGLPVVYLPVGENRQNIGITALSLQKRPAADQEYEVLLQLHNEGTVTTTFSVELLLDGDLINAVPFSVDAKSTRTEVISQSFGTGGVLEARIVSNDKGFQDALSIDNRAFAYVPEQQSIQVAFVSQGGDYFLKAALLANTSIEAFELSPDAWSKASGSRYDVVIFHNALPAVLPQLPYLIFDGAVGPGTPTSQPSSAPASSSQPALPAEPHGPAMVIGESVLPKLGLIDYRHPVVDAVGLDGIRIARARMLAPPEWGRVIVDGSQGPLVVAGEHKGTRALYFSFDPNDSDLPLRVGFLNLLANSINWLAGSGSLPEAYVTAPGAGVPELFASQADAVVRHEESKREERLRDASLAAPGVYTVLREGEEEGVFVVSLSSQEESRIAPVASLGLGEKPAPMLQGIFPGREAWWFLALGALCFLAIEWFLYRRRLVQ